MENVCSRGFKIWRILAVDLMFLKWESILAEASKIMFKFGEGKRKRERGGGGMGGIFFRYLRGYVISAISTSFVHANVNRKRSFKNILITR